MIDEKNQKSVHQQQRKEIQTQKRELGTVQFIKEEEEEVEEREGKKRISFNGSQAIKELRITRYVINKHFTYTIYFNNT